MRRLCFVALLLGASSLGAETRISNCGEPAIEAEWRNLIDEMGEISAAERRDAIAVNRKRHEICQQIESGELTLEEGMSAFDAERQDWKARSRMRKRIDNSEFVTG